MTSFVVTESAVIVIPASANPGDNSDDDEESDAGNSQFVMVVIILLDIYLLLGALTGFILDRKGKLLLFVKSQQSLMKSNFDIG